MTWVQFTKAFFNRFIAFSLSNRMRGDFDRLDKRSMTILEYEAHFISFIDILMLVLPSSLRMFRSS